MGAKKSSNDQLLNPQTTRAVQVPAMVKATNKGQRTRGHLVHRNNPYANHNYGGRPRQQKQNGNNRQH